MQLKLDENYRIVTDSSGDNYILENYKAIENKQDKSVSRKWISLGYFGGQLDFALNRYVNEVIKSKDDAVDVKGLVEEIHRLRDNLKEIVKKSEIVPGDFKDKKE